MKYLSPLVGVKWRALGSALRMKRKVLKLIATRAGKRSPGACFSDMLTQWLTRDVTEQDKPTLKKLFAALCNDSVGEEGLGSCLKNALRKMKG